MTTDMAGLENVLIVMAVCMVLQTLMFVGAAVAGFVAWRRASDALAEARLAAAAQVADLRVHLDRLSSNVDQASRAVVRGSAEVSEVVSDVRGAMGSVRNGVGTVASVMTGRRAALAMGLWRGFQMWRKRRAPGRVAAVASQA